MWNFRELPKKPTQALIARDQQTILVADKFGDVFRYARSHNLRVKAISKHAFYSYPLHPVPTNTENDDKKEEVSEFTPHENQSGGTLVLGHVSLLTAALLSQVGRHIITADRDEHIRVSWYPQGYCIESYCLGHKKYGELALLDAAISSLSSKDSFPPFTYHPLRQPFFFLVVATQ